MMFGGGGGRGGGRAGKKKGKPVVHHLDVTLEHMYKGTTKKLAINRNVLDGPVVTCPKCNGSGTVTQVIRMGPMIQQMRSACPACKGKGQEFKLKNMKEIVEVYVDRGSTHEKKIAFEGKGDEAPDQETGDVIFVLNELPHDTFKRDKADLTVTKSVTLLEALTGFTTEVTHLDGRKLLLKTKPGEVLKPQPAGEGPEWVMDDDYDSPGTDVAKAGSADVKQLKGVCEQRGYDGFIIDKKEGAAYFREKSRAEWLSGKKKSKGYTLWVCPDMEKARAFRMKKAVVGEGMPYPKNPMLKGNLFLEISIDFPASIAEDAAKTLKKILPGPKASDVPKETDEHEVHFLDDMDPETSAKQAAHSFESEEDDEDGHPGMAGGQNVQCAQQ